MIERLESRIAPAGLSVYKLHGTLFVISGDTDTHTLIVINELPDRTIQVVTESSTFSPLGGVGSVSVSIRNAVNHTIDFNFDHGVLGSAAVFTTAASGTNTIRLLSAEAPGILVSGGPGDDIIQIDSDVKRSVVVANAGEGANSLTVNGDVGGSVRFTGGNDGNTINIAGTVGHGGVFSVGTGNDTINLLGTSSFGSVSVSDRGGTNTFNLAGTVTGKAGISAGGGNDTLTQSAGRTIGSLVFFGGGGTNMATINGTVTNSVFVTGGAGNDNVSLPNGATAGGPMRVFGGDGTNETTIGGDITRNLLVVGGNGNDTLTFQATASAGLATAHLNRGTNQTTIHGTFGGNVFVDGGTEADSITLSEGVSIGGNATFVLGAGGNLFTGTSNIGAPLGQVGGNLRVTAGSGDDVVRLTGFTVGGSAAVLLGPGVNLLEIPVRGLGVETMSFMSASLTYSGTGGSDTVTIGSSNSVIGPGVINLGSGDDFMTYTGTSAVFSRLTVNGGKDSDTFTGESVVAGIPTRFIGIENFV